MKFKAFKVALIFFFSLSLAGCMFIFQGGRRSDIEKIEKLSREINDLNATKSLLEDRLSQEIKDSQVRLQMMERGLVITFVADVLFDSGKALIKPEAYASLDKVARVLEENVPDLRVGVEGHTDNEPIKYSRWKSNWDLSVNRALSVLDYFIKQKDINAERLSVSGYGEYQSVAANDTKEGRMMNRRVEVVIMPALKKVKGVKKIKTPAVEEPAEKLK